MAQMSQIIHSGFSMLQETWIHIFSPTHVMRSMWHINQVGVSSTWGYDFELHQLQLKIISVSTAQNVPLKSKK